MSTPTNDELEFYAKYGIITDPGRFVGLLKNLPPDISQLCSVIQGLLLHVFWAKQYGEMLSEEREAEAGIRHVEQILSRIQEIDAGPITDGRPLNSRFAGNCRTYSVLLATVLQSQGTPARARCGFGRYFEADRYEDHWICEYWNDEQDRWIMVDAQLDAFQCRELDVRFDPLDVPRDQFIVGGKAWLICRHGDENPDRFGILDMRGLWFVRGNLIRDVAALNKMALLPWDGWGLINRKDRDISDEELALLDNIASMTSDEVDCYAIRDAYETNKGLAVPPIIRSFTKSGSIYIELSTEKAIKIQ